MSSPSATTAKKVRRRRRRERQAVVFGLLIAVMAVAALAAVAIYDGTLASPITVPFKSAVAAPDPKTTPPCVPEGTLPVGYNKVKINVYNSSDKRGVAAGAARTLEQRGFRVLSTGNSTDPVGGVRISFGEKGLARAYTLAAHFDDPGLFYDARTGATLDVTIGQNYSGLTPPGEVTLDADTPMTAFAGCQPIAELTPAPAPLELPPPA